MMFRVTIEAIDEERTAVVGRAEIRRIETPFRPDPDWAAGVARCFADYGWELFAPAVDNTRDVDRVENLPLRRFKSGRLEAFPRRRRAHTVNAFDLLYRVLRDAVHYRNRE